MERKRENEEKKKYLRGYRKHGRRIERISAELEEIKNMKVSPSVKTDGMPHGTDQTDLSDYVAKLDDLEQELYEEGVEQVREYRDISWKIKQIEDEDERDVLFYRYIKGLEFWDISQKMGYCERHIHRLHGRALEHIKI